MKSFRVVVLLSIVLGFAMVNAFAQADVYKGGEWKMLPFTDPNGNVWGPYYSTQTLKLVTPEGNIMIKIETQLDPNDPRIPENGVNKIPSVAYYYVNDVYYQTLDGEKLYHSDGKALSVYHVNGQREVNFELETYSRFFLDCTSEFIQGSVVQEYIDWNYNVHMDFYGFYLGEVSGLDYSMRGGCNERIESEGKIVTVPLVLKRGDKIVAIGDIKYYIERDSNGEIVGEQIGYDIKCW